MEWWCKRKFPQHSQSLKVQQVCAPGLRSEFQTELKRVIKSKPRRTDQDWHLGKTLRLMFGACQDVRLTESDLAEEGLMKDQYQKAHKYLALASEPTDVKTFEDDRSIKIVLCFVIMDE